MIRKISLSGPIATVVRDRDLPRVSSRTLEHLLDGLEKSQARMASFPLVPNFIVSFMCANSVDWDQQLPVGHVSRLFRKSPLSFLFILSVFFPRRTRLSSSWLLVRLSVWPRARARATATTQGRETLREGFLKGHWRRFLTRVLPFVPSAIYRHGDLNFKPYRKC